MAAQDSIPERPSLARAMLGRSDSDVREIRCREVRVSAADLSGCRNLHLEKKKLSLARRTGKKGNCLLVGFALVLKLNLPSVLLQVKLSQRGGQI